MEPGTLIPVEPSCYACYLASPTGAWAGSEGPPAGVAGFPRLFLGEL